ncbi:hypothetical protein Ocin01_12221 [Orchesella cincta]|uniref:Uncharacterized protein n=1 Tax=Orchesella cincta TaxID=48709 RepID=A0A1D2MNP3_ORCCI|nr:hypothetical protein Ocin01_12221 [Orchesella cincta]
MSVTPQSQSSLVGPSWIFPEMVSFFVRFSVIMAIGCITENAIGTIEKVLLLLAGVIFLLNCFEFSRPPSEVIVLYTLSALLSAVCVILMVAEASVNETYSPVKYYITIFKGVATVGSTIVMGYFYLFQLNKKP